MFTLLRHVCSCGCEHYRISHYRNIRYRNTCLQPGQAAARPVSLTRVSSIYCDERKRAERKASMATGPVATKEIQTAEPGISRWWRVVGGVSMNLALGTLYAWSVFVAPLEKQFGWKRADTSMVFTIAVVVFALSFVVAGRIQDKDGPLSDSMYVG